MMGESDVDRSAKNLRSLYRDRVKDFSDKRVNKVEKYRQRV